MFELSRIGRLARPGLVLALGLAVTACAFPRKDFAGVPDASVIRVVKEGEGYRAVAPDCAPLQQPSQYNHAENLRMVIAFGCATYTNLAGQVVRPQDLEQPRTYGGQPADTAASAVQRYREGKVTPLRETATTKVGK